MDEPIKKRVDESWKEQAEREKRVAPAAASASGPASSATSGAAQAPEAHSHQSHEQHEQEEGGLPHARFDLFISGLAMEALIALGDMPHPTTRKQAANLPQAKYLIDLLGVLEEKTKGNLIVEEDKLLNDALYQLRMRYLAKAGS